MKPTRTTWFAACAVLAAMASGGCKNPPAPPPPAPPQAKIWTPETIAADPEGYLTHQQGQIANSVTERKDRLGRLSQRRDQIRKRQEELATNIKELQNVATRLGKAVAKSEDDDRWPIQMGGRTFTKEKANAIIRSCQTYVEDFKPLSQEYDGAMGKLDLMEDSLKKDIGDLGRLQAKLEIDLERVRLKKGMGELADLRKTEAELAALSQQLGRMDDDLLGMAVAAQKQPQRIDPETLLK